MPLPSKYANHPQQQQQHQRGSRSSFPFGASHHHQHHHQHASTPLTIHAMYRYDLSAIDSSVWEGDEAAALVLLNNNLAQQNNNNNNSNNSNNGISNNNNNGSPGLERSGNDFNVAALRAVIPLVLDHLGPRDLCRVTSICRDWYILGSDDYLWRRLCRMFFLRNRMTTDISSLAPLPTSSHSMLVGGRGGHNHLQQQQQQSAGQRVRALVRNRPPASPSSSSSSSSQNVSRTVEGGAESSSSSSGEDGREFHKTPANTLFFYKNCFALFGYPMFDGYWHPLCDFKPKKGTVFTTARPSVAIFGARKTGKTCFAKRAKGRDPPTVYVPTMARSTTYTGSIPLDPCFVSSLGQWRFRLVEHPGFVDTRNVTYMHAADCYMLTYSVDDYKSFESIPVRYI
eukprot:TRINITY_DN6182_c0_g1_i4.p1 TRINITY_DN6182_c0_g1~~TRINITY_DN6182_c0_g1_i4.p1  ORF type:complete len:419 (-),score=90.04 TRINITY_DN6182_c0_g1_i4:495-1688(-)